MKTKKVKISGLKPHPKNPNAHPAGQITELQSSLKQFDQVKNIVTWQGYIIAGHGLVTAAEKQGIEYLKAVDVSDWPEEKAIKLMIADNRLAEMSEINDVILTDILKDFDSALDIPGIDETYLDDLNLEINNDEEKEPSEVATKPFGDDRDKMSIRDLLHSVDLVKVSFSGGKDSVGMAIYLHTHFKIPKEKMLLEHYYNPFEWEDMVEYCKYFTDKFGVELKIYGNEAPDKEKEKVKIYGKRNADNFMIEKIKNVGLPSPMQKWCFERYKQRLFTYIARRHKEINYIQTVGMRAAESPRRSKMEDRGITRNIQPFCYPIFNLSADETFQLAIKNNIEVHHAYRFFARTGCPFCPMQSHKNFKILRKEYPEVWDKMLKLYLLSLESDFYRTSSLNRPKDDLDRILGTRSDKARKKDWAPPKGLTFWRGDLGERWQDVFQPR